MTPEYDQDEVKKAFDIIKAAMQMDCPEEGGSYAHSWHRNIAMTCNDAILADEDGADLPGNASYRIGNDAATRFMKLCFDVDTKA